MLKMRAPIPLAPARLPTGQLVEFDLHCVGFYLGQLKTDHSLFTQHCLAYQWES